MPPSADRLPDSQEAGAHHLPPPLEDPGKQYRSTHGVPVVPAFDGYRALAVLAVVLFHLLAQSGLLVRAGESFPAQLVWGTLPWAADVFFIVSGFVMFLPTVAREGDFGRLSSYTIRRAARVYPALWVGLAISLILIVTLPGTGVSVPGVGVMALDVAGLAGWSTLFDQSISPGFGINGPLWTLTVEVSFYLVLPLIAVSYFRHPLIGLLVGAAIAIGWREVFLNLGEVASVVGISLSPQKVVQLQFATNQLPHWAFSFAAGMTSAWAYVRLRQSRERASLERAATVVGGVALVALCFFVFLAGRHVIDTHPAAVVHLQWQSSFLVIGYTAALAAMMLALAFAPTRLQAPFTHPLLRHLADISYGVYLIHAVLLWVIATQFTLPQGSTIAAFAILTVAVLPLSLAYGYVSARFLEQPIRRRAQRYTRRTQSPRPAGPAVSAPG